MADESPVPFTVAFGKTMRVVEFRDADGIVEFAYDHDPSTGGLFLEHHSLHTRRPANYAFAFAQTKRYLESRGYTIAESGTAELPDPYSPEKVSELIERELPDVIAVTVRLIVPPREATLWSRNGPAFRLWLVAEAFDGAHRDYKLVFDDRTGQFGIANEANVFLGFWGNLEQTLAALTAVS